ncbi:hypothetical protein M1349_03995 [Patescibacteria group bacterium]|nr:hypothetical protein [Patescibacteria group bacterium]
MLRMVKDSGEVVIEEDLSEKSPKRTAEITIFTAPRLIKRILEQNT